MGLVLRLATRIDEDERRTRGLRDGNEHGHNARDEYTGLPWWAILVVVYATIITLVFLSSMLYYWKRGKAFPTSMQHCIRPPKNKAITRPPIVDRPSRLLKLLTLSIKKESKRGQDGHYFRTGHVVWKAFSIATGLWIWSWVFKGRGWCGSVRTAGGAAGGGPYSQIQARQAFGASAASPPAPGSTGIKVTGPNTPARHGILANQSPGYKTSGQSHGASETPGHKSTRRESIPLGILSQLPSLSHASPPPYKSRAPPAELDGRDFQPQSTGRR